MNALGDSLAFAITREESEDVATEQMNIEKQNEKNLSKYPTSRLSDYQYYLNLRLKDQILQAGIEEQTNLTVNSNGKNIGVVKFEISAS
ncbi:hypothetical protein IJM86_01135 [bacterium]|nr:hypothetical protein [bacterium]